MSGAGDFTRREFAELAGAGLFVFLPPEAAKAQQRQGYPSDFNAYLRIAPDGRVECFVGKVELGQGSKTALAQLLAEELEVDLDSVDTVMSDTGVCPWDMGTFGSLSIRQFGPVLKAAAAEARAVLAQMGAERLGVPAERLQAKSGVLSDSGSGKRVSYAELVAGRRIERHIANAPLRPVKLYSVVGQSPRRKDGLDKVTGRAKYAGDFRLPGLLHARLVRPPAHGAAIESVDTSAAEKTDGVRVVREGDMVAVLHEHRDVADRARSLVKARFGKPRPGANDQTIFDHFMKNAPPGQVIAQTGDLSEGEKLSSAIVQQTYLNSYVAHAAMETHSATAVVENGKATVWASTQTPFPVRLQVAQALGMEPGNVRIVSPYVGGGFGGKSASRQAIEAARLAKITGKPVQVVWDRGEEFFFDTFRPAAVVKIRSGLTSAGRIALWDFHVIAAGDREAKQFYDVPHQRTVSSGNWSGQQGMHPFATGPWRGPSVNTNTFARESHIDALAVKAGMDPLEFRLHNLADARMRRVLAAAAKRFGWKPGKAPSGRGAGVACAIYLGTWVATMAEVSVDRSTGKVRVRRVVCAQDQGVVVSPDGSRQQIEGAITMGLGYALTEEVRFRDGEVLARNFDDYEIPRFSWLPEIGIVLIDNPETAASGCGEPPVVTMGAVIANAIHDAVGIRLLQLPMTPARIREALQKV
jgi:nicotinate dehydrogenase subunit B